MQAIPTVPSVTSAPSLAFVRDAWYVAGWSNDFGRHLTRRIVLEDPLVLFRREDGTLAALEDRCPHRFLPLSMGCLRGDSVECGYHGMTFDGDGRCVRIPEQNLIPDNARVRAYPTRERMGLAWVWMGDGEADESRLFHLPQYDDPAWGVGHGDAMHVRANYLSLADNLCDPAHVSFVHTSTLGSAAGIGVPVHSKTVGDTVLTWRWTLDSEPVGFFRAFGSFAGNVDRWQYYYLHAPSIAVIDFGSTATRGESHDLDALPDDAVRVFSCHFMTPETATTSVDYWLHVRNFDVANPATSEAISEQFRIAFAEDKQILEAVQAEEERRPDVSPLRIGIDAGSARLRRVIDALLAKQGLANERR